LSANDLDRSNTAERLMCVVPTSGANKQLAAASAPKAEIARIMRRLIGTTSCIAKFALISPLATPHSDPCNRCPTSSDRAREGHHGQVSRALVKPDVGVDSVKRPYILGRQCPLDLTLCDD